MLTSIRSAQEAGFEGDSGYREALAEIQNGQKKSHWIWWVWPSMDGVRATSKPAFSIPDFACAVDYLGDATLSARLLEITEAAVQHLADGTDPLVLFGGAGDIEKFHEAMTLFGVAAAVRDDADQATVLLGAIDAIDAAGNLDAKTMDVINEQFNNAAMKGVTTVAELEEAWAGMN